MREEKKMQISKEEMKAILVMYRIVCAEGQESDIMVGLAKRIEKEKRRYDREAELLRNLGGL